MKCREVNDSPRDTLQTGGLRVACLYPKANSVVHVALQSPGEADMPLRSASPGAPPL